jgi:hypothetical protein
MAETGGDRHHVWLGPVARLTAPQGRCADTPPGVLTNAWAFRGCQNQGHVVIVAPGAIWTGASIRRSVAMAVTRLSHLQRRILAWLLAE